MTGAAGAGEAQRLDELAAVTREYGAYSRQRRGVALVGAGAWAMASVGVTMAGAGATGQMMLLGLPAVWGLALVLARRRYARRGVITAPGLLDSFSERWFRRIALAVVVGWYVAILGFAVSEADAHWRGWAVAALAIGCAALVVKTVRSAPDASSTLALVVLGGLCARGAGPTGWAALVAAGYAVGAIAVGAWEEVRFRRLERRLAAVREAR